MINHTGKGRRREEGRGGERRREERRGASLKGDWQVASPLLFKPSLFNQLAPDLLGTLVSLSAPTQWVDPYGKKGWVFQTPFRYALTPSVGRVKAYLEYGVAVDVVLVVVGGKDVSVSSQCLRQYLDNLSRWSSCDHSLFPRIFFFGKFSKKLQTTFFFFFFSFFCNSVVRPPLSRQHRCVFSSPVAGTPDTYSLEEVSLVAAGALERRVARAACPVRKWHRYASAPATPTPQKTKKRKSTECSDVPIEFHLIVTSREGGLSHRHVFISHTHGIPRINKLWGPVQQWDKRGARPIDDVIGHWATQSRCRSPPPPPSLPPLCYTHIHTHTHSLSLPLLSCAQWIQTLCAHRADHWWRQRGQVCSSEQEGGNKL